MSRKNVLCVDFDYFFPNPMEAGDLADPNAFLYDWGHREAPLFIDGPLWAFRAEAFLAAGLPLPQVDVPPDWWSRFRFAPGVELRLCDSNAHAGNLTSAELGGRVGEVWLFDAHHDAGYGSTPLAGMRAWRDHAGTLSCEDWMIDLAADGATLHVRYPRWRARAMELEPEPAVQVGRSVDDLEPLDIRFHAVLMCRSGAWVPPWCDAAFTALAEQFPGKARWIDDATHPRAAVEVSEERVAAMRGVAQAGTLG